MHKTAELAPPLGAAHPEAGWALLLAHPVQITCHLGVGPNLLDGVELPGQRRLGEQGVQLPVTGWAQLCFWTKPAAPRARDQVVYGVTVSLAQAKLARCMAVARPFVVFSRAGGGAASHRGYSRTSGLKKRQPGRSTRHSPSSSNMGRTRPCISRRSAVLSGTRDTPNGRKAKACSSST